MKCQASTAATRIKSIASATRTASASLLLTFHCLATCHSVRSTRTAVIVQRIQLLSPTGLIPFLIPAAYAVPASPARGPLIRTAPLSLSLTSALRCRSRRSRHRVLPTIQGAGKWRAVIFRFSRRLALNKSIAHKPKRLRVGGTPCKLLCVIRQ